MKRQNVRSKKPPASALENEVAGLVADCTAAEVELAVWTRFEAAFSGLSPETARLLSEFFSGVGIEKLAALHNLSESQVRDYLKRGKRDLIEQLRRKSAIRQ